LEREERKKNKRKIRKGKEARRDTKLVTEIYGERTLKEKEL